MASHFCFVWKKFDKKIIEKKIEHAIFIDFFLR